MRFYARIWALFYTDTHRCALRNFWQLPLYLNHIALETEFLRLQKEKKIPSSPVEDLTELLEERSTASLMKL